MSTTININVTGGSDSASISPVGPPGLPSGDVGASIKDVHDMMGDQIGPFPPAGIDGFLSHFIIMVRFRVGPMQGQVVSFTSPPAVQVVTRSDPFIYRGPEANHAIRLGLPPGATLSNGSDPSWTTITEKDFLNRKPSSPDFPEAQKYFQVGRETVWMQIIDLDARMDTEFGPIRIVLGQTLKDLYGDAGDPELLMPSLGVAQSLRDSGGFPAMLFFNPIAVVETPFGPFKAIHGTLAYGRVTGFPPLGTPVTIAAPVPLPPVAVPGAPGAIPTDPIGEIIALSHPIDVSMQVPGSEAFGMIRDLVKRHAPSGGGGQTGAGSAPSPAAKRG